MKENRSSLICWSSSDTVYFTWCTPTNKIWETGLHATKTRDTTENDQKYETYVQQQHIKGNVQIHKM
jgi:hypothetical protein